jgi:hypothetical protein
MQFSKLLNDPLFAAGRRAFIGKSGVLLSASAVALLAGRDVLAAETKESSASAGNDVRILNTALGAEHQAVAAYQVGAESKLLKKQCSPLPCSSRDIIRSTSMS